MLSILTKLHKGNGKFFVFVGADGPCTLSVNVGGKIFRAHHDEINRGLIAGGNATNPR
jgi:hypothetical protein